MQPSFHFEKFLIMSLLHQVNTQGNKNKQNKTQNTCNSHSTLQNSWSCPHYTKSMCRGTKTKQNNREQALLSLHFEKFLIMSSLHQFNMLGNNNQTKKSKQLRTHATLPPREHMQLSLHFQKFIGYHLRHAHKHFKRDDVPQTQHFALYCLWILPELLVSRWGLSASQ